MEQLGWLVFADIRERKRPEEHLTNHLSYHEENLKVMGQFEPFQTSTFSLSDRCYMLPFCEEKALAMSDHCSLYRPLKASWWRLGFEVPWTTLQSASAFHFSLKFSASPVKCHPKGHEELCSLAWSPKLVSFVLMWFRGWGSWPHLRWWYYFQRKSKYCPEDICLEYAGIFAVVNGNPTVTVNLLKGTYWRFGSLHVTYSFVSK